MPLGRMASMQDIAEAALISTRALHQRHRPAAAASPPIDARRSRCGGQTDKNEEFRMSGSGKIDELIEASRELYNRKLIHAAGGNTSVRDGDVVRITQTGAELAS